MFCSCFATNFPESFRWRGALPLALAVLLLFSACGGSPTSPDDGGGDETIPPGIGQIVFIGLSPLGSYHLFLIRPDGTNSTALFSADDQASYTGPSWSPDGNQIALASNLGGQADYDLYVVNTDGTGLRAVVDDPLASDFAPAWSPDGTKIAFQSTRKAQNGWDILVVNADGTGLRNLTDFSGDEQLPAWSPDGTKIALQWSYGGGTDIYVMDADGTNRTRLTPGGNVQYSAPAWSPDGTRIAFESTRHQPLTGEVEFGLFEIYTMNADGSDMQRLTFDATGSQVHRFPTWSPDGNHVAFEIQFLDGQSLIMRSRLGVMKADGSGRYDIPNLPVDSKFPRWSPVP